MNIYQILKVTDENVHLLQPLADEASLGGDNFIQKTIDEWVSGKNKFSKEKEFFVAIMIDDKFVACGGLNQDPYVSDNMIGRVRHLYVSKNYRRKGYAKIILNLIIDEAKKVFDLLRLTTHNSDAASLYESIGFKKVDEYKANYLMKL